MKHVIKKDAPLDESSADDEERDETDHRAPWTPERREHMKTVVRRGKALPDELPEALKVLTIRSLRKLDKVIKLPIDEENGALLRSIVTSCGIAISSQLRADEHQLKAKAHGDALQRLLKIIEKERALLQDRRQGTQKATAEEESTNVARCSGGRPIDECDPDCDGSCT